jgi:RNA-directed DNA polymerase
MSEESPVNIGALLADPVGAGRRVLKMQTKLHAWAAAERGRRFDDLFNLVADPAFLVTAWERVRRNTGARSAGVDQRTVRAILESPEGAAGLLEDIRTQLKQRTFGPLPVRERMIPKPGTAKRRRLGIPTVADRVVQASLKQVLEPILEVDFSPSSYGFRPGRRAQDAIEDIRHKACKGYEWVFEADIAACFDEIDHTALLGRLRGRIADKRVINLVKAFLHAGILTEQGDQRDTITGTPQGGILSPLLANLALTGLDDHFQSKWDTHSNASARWQHRNRGGATYRLIRYADDFVVMVFGTRQHAEMLWDEVSNVLAGVGLRLAPEKTRVVHIDEGFDFLGFHIQRHQQKGSTRRFIYTYPSRKAQKAIRRKVKALTGQITHQAPDEIMQRLNRMVRGWAQYFRHSSASRAFHHLGHYLWWRYWGWLKNKHPHTPRMDLVRRYYRGWQAEYNGTSLCQPAAITIQRYRFRGQIPSPWDPPIPGHSRGLVESRMR